MENKTRNNFWLGLGVGVLAVGLVISGAIIDRISGIKLIDDLIKKESGKSVVTSQRTVVADEESVVTKVVAEASPSVVTVAINSPNLTSNQFPGFDFFGNFFNTPQPTSTPQNNYRNIGTGFVISSDGLIVTNKHVVADTTAKYQVLIGKSDTENVVNIYRDPLSDLAILKINKTGLVPLPLGDSDQIKVGQTVIAIGTALGEFNSTVTKGVISGLGRAITAGSPLEGSEKLDNVIQTDAAINPGNSGGPLLNSSGQAIGVNVAVSQAGQSIGFALPINLIKQSIDNFRTTGEFDRPYIGVSYRMISKQTALMNDMPSGAYVQSVLAGSPAEKVGIKEGDVITEIDGTKLADNPTFSIADYVNKKKIGDNVTLKFWRDNKEQTVTVKLEKKS
jgi:serine protease Do